MALIEVNAASRRPGARALLGKAREKASCRQRAHGGCPHLGFDWNGGVTVHSARAMEGGGSAVSSTEPPLQRVFTGPRKPLPRPLNFIDRVQPTCHPSRKLPIRPTSR